MALAGRVLYDDGLVAIDGDGLTIRRYYVPWGDKRIPYSAIRAVTRLPLSGWSKVRRWRLWGSGDFVHWWNLDPGRSKKSVALVVELTGRRVRPTITPDDPDAVEQILNEHLSQGDSPVIAEIAGD